MEHNLSEWTDRMGADWDVVIIGGGAAGIGAASRLAASGLSTLLLEASQRIGGRAWTVNVAGQALDLGCGWLHSADRNPWVDIAEASGFIVDRSSPAWGQQYRDLGFPQDEQDAADKAYEAWYERLTNIAAQRPRRRRPGAGWDVERLPSGDQRLYQRRRSRAPLDCRLSCL